LTEEHICVAVPGVRPQLLCVVVIDFANTDSQTVSGASNVGQVPDFQSQLVAVVVINNVVVLLHCDRALVVLFADFFDLVVPEWVGGKFKSNLDILVVENERSLHGLVLDDVVPQVSVGVFLVALIDQF